MSRVLSKFILSALFALFPAFPAFSQSVETTAGAAETVVSNEEEGGECNWKDPYYNAVWPEKPGKAIKIKIKERNPGISAQTAGKKCYRKSAGGGISSFLDPSELKAMNCQYMRDTVEYMSCLHKARGAADIDSGAAGCEQPVREKGHFSSLIFKIEAANRCSFECSVGKEMCDETFNPKSEDYFFDPAVPVLEEYASYPICPQVRDSFLEADTQSEQTVFDKDGDKYIIYETVYADYDKEDGEFCSEIERYLSVCDAECRQCQASGGAADCEKLIEEYSEEWMLYKERRFREKYQASCFVPTAEDCARISEEKDQCVLDVAKRLTEDLCERPNPLWLYRRESQL